MEEFTYSYEADLMDDEGNILLVYVEKDTGVTTEPLDVGNLYSVTGISELYNGSWQIKPRFQTDFAEIFPPELMLELDVRNSILPGETLTYTLTAYNHTGDPLTNVRIEATPACRGCRAGSEYSTTASKKVRPSSGSYPSWLAVEHRPRLAT